MEEAANPYQLIKPDRAFGALNLSTCQICLFIKWALLDAKNMTHILIDGHLLYVWLIDIGDTPWMEPNGSR